MAKQKKPGKKYSHTKPAAKQKKVIAKKRTTNLVWVIPFILLISFVIYVPSFKGAFVWDDDRYIQHNPLITSIDLKALFSTYVMGNYHPLTMLTYAIEYQFFGLNPVGYHVINLLLHVMNVLLVFYVVFHLSGKVIVALIACLLFGIHPMHVESVAWASELKDLLYSFFFLASYIFYLKYLKDQEKKLYYFSLLLFLCSLLSKGMAVSLPVVLLLTDYFEEGKITRRRIMEKIPFFVLAVIFGIVAILAQKSSEAIQDITKFAFLQRIVFASYGFINYLLKLILPYKLSAFYPYPITSGENLPGYYYLFPLFLIMLTILVIYSFRFSKKFFWGIGFFGATVFLVLQLLPVGDAVMADRYSYIPSIGVFYLAGEGFYWLWNRNRKTVSIIMAGVFAIFFSIRTYARCSVWENGLILWSDVIDKYPTVAVAYNNRGGALMNEKRYEEALNDYNKAIELRPNYYDAYNNRGILHSEIQKKQEALRDYNKAIEFGPNHPEVYSNRGLLFMEFNKYKEALSDFNKAIELQPDYSLAYYNRGLLAMNQGKNPQAYSDYAMAIKLNPAYVEAYINRGVLFHNENKFDEAITEYNKAAELQPANPQIYYDRGLALMAKKNYDGAINDFSKTIELKSDYSAAYYNRGIVNINLGRKDIGCKDLQLAAKFGFPSANDAIQKFCR
jgi:tetratricopeptide (TPR) repeat protein